MHRPHSLRPWLTNAVLGGACLAVAWMSLAGAETVSKRGYHLFKPVPTEQMRELSTDRPDKTESPYTVDAGHIQVEMDILTYTHDTSDSERVERYGVGIPNIKLGLLPHFDMQLILETYNWEHTRDRQTGVRTRRSGFGDLTMRFKLNLWGNDGGPTAFAVMPFLKLPTNQDGLGNHAVEGGLIFPLAVELPWGFGLGLMTELDINQDTDGHGHHAEFINTITLGHDIVGNLAGYIEFFSLVSTDRDAPWVGTIDLGLTYQLTDNIQLDAGINIGITDSADDLNPFVGVTARF